MLRLYGVLIVPNALINAGHRLPSAQSIGPNYAARHRSNTTVSPEVASQLLIITGYHRNKTPGHDRDRYM